jgi:DNA-binding PadR family transcriptional regulator
MTRQAILGEFEQLVLLAVLQLDDNAYGPEISALLEERAGRQVSRGALYSSLDRLEAKGFLEWRLHEPSPERGGHPKRCFNVTEMGMVALRTAREAMRNLSTGLEDLLGEA